MKKNNIKDIIGNQLKLIVYLSFSIILSTAIVWFITNYLFQYSEIYLSVLGSSGLEEIILGSFILVLIPLYLLHNLITLIPYLKPIKYNFHFIFLSVLVFMLIPIGITAEIANNIGFYLANKSTIPYDPSSYTDLVDFFGILSFLIIYPLQYIFVVLIVGGLFKKYKNIKK